MVVAGDEMADPAEAGQLFEVDMDHVSGILPLRALVSRLRLQITHTHARNVIDYQPTVVIERSASLRQSGGKCAVNGDLRPAPVNSECASDRRLREYSFYPSIQLSLLAQAAQPLVATAEADPNSCSQFGFELFIM